VEPLSLEVGARSRPDASKSWTPPSGTRDPKLLPQHGSDPPLFDPPKLKLDARRNGESVHVALEGTTMPVTTRWEGDGDVVGSGLEVTWRPARPSDRIRVTVRSRGGVATLSLRADQARLVV
jgi:hypothetical protein